MRRGHGWVACLTAVVVVLIGAHGVQGGESDAERESIDGVLDAFHSAASKADGATYFEQLTADAVFLGTDATERWPRTAFEAFAKPYFDQGKGWSYASTTRHVDIEADGAIAWFDELLTNEHYGTCRGTGVLRKTGAGWRIAQYSLSIPIPNPLARDVVARIRGHDAAALSSATVYVVHAAKPLGRSTRRARALRLCRVLRHAGLDRIHATEDERSRELVAATSVHLGVEVVHYAGAKAPDLAAALRSDTKSEAVLVATTDGDETQQLLRLLGVADPVVVGDDDLFVVTLRTGQAPRVQHLHYGG